MRKRRRRKRKTQNGEKGSQPVSWMGTDGMHALIPGEAPNTKELEEMTKEYQTQIRNSPLWADMVEQYGEEEAERLLKKFRVEIR